MFKPLAHSWRRWWQAGVVVWLVTCWVTNAPSSDLSTIGEASRPVSPPDQALIDATLPIEPEAGIAEESIESPPMYRLPAVDETSDPAFEEVTDPAFDETYDVISDETAGMAASVPAEEMPAEATTPTITILPPIDRPALPALAAPLPSGELVAPAAPSEVPIETSLVPVDEAPPEVVAPSITILPPVDAPLPPVAEIARLPAPTELAASTEPTPPVEQAVPTEPADEIVEDFDAAWNDRSRIAAVDEPSMTVSESAPWRRWPRSRSGSRPMPPQPPNFRGNCCRRSGGRLDWRSMAPRTPHKPSSSKCSAASPNRKTRPKASIHTPGRWPPGCERSTRPTTSHPRAPSWKPM